MFLMIENVNEAPVESFTVFGASTRRGEENSIGQFGSGAKFGTLVCMRFGLNPVIYSGKDKIEFFSEPMVMGGKNFSRVCYRHKTKTEKTSYTLEFGALDWNNCHMGLREYVSNAIDGADGDMSGVSVKVVDNTRAKSGYTRIFVPLTPEVQQFYSDLPNRFLQFSELGDSRGVIEKEQDSTARIYLKGVFVRQIEKHNSIFDYNFGSDLRIDESRNLSDYSVRYAVEQHLGKLENSGHIRKVVGAVCDGKDYWECHFGGFGLTYGIRNRAGLWRKEFHALYGDNAIICGEAHRIFLKRLEGKGFRPVLVNHNGWVNALKDAGIKTVLDVLDDVNDEGHQIRDASETSIQTAKRVWGWIEAMEMTKGKQIPPVKEFVAHMDGGSHCGGYYKEGTVYIEHEYVGNTKVMLEEMAHYITGSTDNSRDFQDFAFKFAAMMGEVMA